MKDPIADLLTRIRNSTRARQRFVDLQWSGIKEAVVKVLKDKGIIAQYLIKEENKKSIMRIFLKYGIGQEPVVEELIRISKPSCRRYVSYRDIPHVRGEIGFSILSTSKGVIDGESAREQKVGGELLCLIY